jgi:hypothetical protein
MVLLPDLPEPVNERHLLDFPRRIMGQQPGIHHGVIIDDR